MKITKKEFEGRSSIIEGKRVKIRAIERRDLEKTLSWANDPEIAYYTNYIFPISMEMEIKWYERILNESTRRTFIIENKEGVVIGLTAILNIDWQNRKAELSMLIGEKEYWGQGYGRESVRTMLNHIFNIMGINKVYGRIIDYNQGALKMDLGAGYSQEGYIKDDIYLQGEFHDRYLVGITRSEFNKQKEERGENY